MAKVKVVNNTVGLTPYDSTFNNIPSQTIFSFGKFTVTANFDRRTIIDYTNVLSSFNKPISLESIGLTNEESDLFYDKTNSLLLNLDKSDLKTYVRFGSAYEFFRISIENIISSYPGALFVDSQSVRGGNITFYDFNYNESLNQSSFKIPTPYLVNNFNLTYNYGNNQYVDNPIKNINISFNDYCVCVKGGTNNCKVIGFTGNTTSRNYLSVVCEGKAFPVTGSTTNARYSFHLKPNNNVFEKYRDGLGDYEKFIVSTRTNDGFEFIIKDPILLEDGNINYTPNKIMWYTSDGYNIDINTTQYRRFLDIMLTIASKYDSIKTDLVARFLTPESLKTYDLTENGKITKLLRLYGKEFDIVRTFIDSILYVNKVTFNKKNNIPDLFVKKLARTLGWDTFSLMDDDELVETLFTIDENERDLNNDLLPTEIDIELWRRIIINTNYLWKSKGTKNAIKSIFLLLGIPEPFINITEYIYTVDGKINPNDVTLTINDFPNNEYPYDSNAYPRIISESNEYYFQTSGDSDSGQNYMNAFRNVGFDLLKTVDNKKSWVEMENVVRISPTTPQYYQENNKLILNTKEIDICLDGSKGLEYDIYTYIKDIDFPSNSSGYTLPYTYVNLSLGYSISANTFTLPSKPEGDVEVRFNGILLNSSRTGLTGSTAINWDYQIIGNNIVLNEYAVNNSNGRDVVEVTYINSGNTSQATSISVKYLACRVKANINGTIIPLPAIPNGDVQLTINGVALTKGTAQLIGDYTVDNNNPSQIIIKNSDLISYLTTDPYIQVAFLNVSGSTALQTKNEVYRVDSVNGNRVYYSTTASKYILKLNYKLNNASDVKILVDGIALEPNTDYQINNNNKYEVFLPRTLRLGSIVSAYYLVGGSELFTPTINDDFGVGDISKLSFLEFIDLLQRKLINVKNRKTVTDFNGGWYPSLYNVYSTYVKRGLLENTNPLHSNGYTVNDMFLFLNKYNTIFQNFLDKLIPATIIIGKSGLTYRNTIFAKQKFTYKRGVNTDSNVNYLGDDGSMFLKRPLSKNIEWSDDLVCVGDLCKKFVIGDINIIYPDITTTTTQYPLHTMVMVDSTLESISLVDGFYNTKTSVLSFNPALLEGYAGTINFRFDFILDGGNLPSNTFQSFSKFTVLVNNIPTYSEEYTIVDSGTTSLTFNSDITINSSDVVIVVQENKAIRDVGMTLPTNPTVISDSNMLLNGINITPNGSIYLITPNIINNHVEIT